jgi:16S rRNA (guanine966-N2)-methyltransferase
MIAGMRIIAGEHRGRRLQAPAGWRTRPTGARVREALFGMLEHGEPPMRGARVLELFCGSGAMALEALSRGALCALLVDRDPAAIAAARANVEALGLTQRARLLLADATRLGPARERFDLVLLDPPYLSGQAVPALEALLAGGWLARPARLVVEVAAREPFLPPTGLRLDKERRHGGARLVFLGHDG